MNTPNIRYYAKMVNTTPKGKKTPKYTIVAQAGLFPAIENLKGRDGRVSFNLMEKLKEGANVPAMRLQAKNSLNFTGLKDYFVDGKVSGYAYGNPPKGETYPYKGKQAPNPFADNQQDGFLFVVHQTGDNLLPDYLELLVIGGCNADKMAARYVKQLEMGGYDTTLQMLRQWAKSV